MTKQASQNGSNAYYKFGKNAVNPYHAIRQKKEYDAWNKGYITAKNWDEKRVEDFAPKFQLSYSFIGGGGSQQS